MSSHFLPHSTVVLSWSYAEKAALICQQNTLNQAAQFVAHHNAFDAMPLFAALQKEQRGNAFNIPLVGQLRLIFDIDPGEKARLSNILLTALNSGSRI